MKYTKKGQETIKSNWLQSRVNNGLSLSLTLCIDSAF